MPPDNNADGVSLQLPHEKVSSYMVKLQQHLADLSRQSRQTGPPLLGEALAEMTEMLEELQVAEEELHVQNDHLMEAARTIEEGRERYHSLFEAAPDPYLVTDGEGVIREANRAAVALLGASPRALAGKPLITFVPLSERPTFRQRLRGLSQEATEGEWELYLKPRYGPAVVAAVTVAAVPGTAGGTSSLRWIVRDISRRRAEEAERYQLFVEGVKDYAILMLDLDGLFTNWNPAAERILGFRAREIIGQHSAIIFTPEDRAAGAPEQELQTARAAGRAEDERWHMRKDGSRFWGSGVMTALRGADGEVASYVKVLRNLTVRHEEEERRAADSRVHRQMADVFQQTILEPVTADAFPRLEVAALYAAAWQESNVGGDFYDAYCLSEDQVVLVVGDVTGKGLSAARRTAEVKFAARVCLDLYADPAQALFHLNNFLCRSHRDNEHENEAFVSLAVAVVDTATGEVSVALAASEPPFVLRADGEADVLRHGSLALGMFPDADYVTESLRLGPGDVLVMLTDGLTEARAPGGEFLDHEGVTALARRALPLGPLQAVGQMTLDGARGFADGALADDVCLLLARRR